VWYCRVEERPVGQGVPGGGDTGDLRGYMGIGRVWEHDSGLEHVVILSNIIAFVSSFCIHGMDTV
jgi:hypothetical protein